MDLISSTGCFGGEWWAADLTGTQTTHLNHLSPSVTSAAFLPLRSKFRLSMRKGTDLSRTPSLATQERMVKYTKNGCWAIFQLFPFLLQEIFRLQIESHTPSSHLSLSFSSIGGSDECGYCTTEQHDHQSDLGSDRQRDGPRTPAGIQGTDSVSPLLFGLTYSAPVLMNNTYISGFQRRQPDLSLARASEFSLVSRLWRIEAFLFQIISPSKCITLQLHCFSFFSSGLWCLFYSTPKPYSRSFSKYF